jgi:type I pantothenate kinase
VVARFVEFDRREWAARGGPDVVPSAAAADGLVSPTDRAEIYGPLAALVVERAEGRAPFVVSVTGSVAVGKSAAAAALAAVLRPREVAVVCTDGFLFPNRVLDARGLTARKGFPESFDHDALQQFILAVRAGAPEARAPVYSHAIYDIVEGEAQVVRHPDVLVLEGLPFPDEHVDFTVYLDADEADIERWFVARFCALCVDARTDDASFFRPFAGYSEEQATRFARSVWAAINHVNLEEHILPVRDTSDVILEKGADHAVRRVRLRVTDVPA